MGINYVPRRADGSNVIRDENGVVIEVLPEYDGSYFSFTFKNGEPVGKKISGEPISHFHFIKMLKQASAIYWQSINERFDDSPLHKRIWPKEERKRLQALLSYKCLIMPDGYLHIEKNHNGKIVEISYGDIDSAVRGQYHIIEKYNDDLRTAEPDMHEEIERKVNYISERLHVLASEKKHMLANITNAISVMTGMLASSEKFFHGSGFDLRLNEVKNYLNSVWLNFLHKQAKRCLSILKDIDVDDNPHKTLRYAINSLETKEINASDLIRSLAKVSNQKNGSFIFETVNALLPKNCLKRNGEFVHIFSLLDIAKKMESNTEITLSKICIECGRRRHCPHS